MWTQSIFCLLVLAVQAVVPDKGGYTETVHGPGFAGASSGSFSNTGNGGGAGAGFVPQFPYNPNLFYPQFPNFPQFPMFPTQPLIDPADFNKIVSDYLGALQKNYANTLTYTYTTPGGTAYATSSLTPQDLYQQQLQHQQAIYEAIRQQAAHTPAAGGYAPNFAGASAAYGPQGVHQTATIYPANPAIPNVDTRFGAENQVPGQGQGQGQFFGVSTSSFSESTDLDGNQSNRRGAVTIVNDNGKVTKHVVHS